eukprot:CFRG6518T1
MALFNVFFDCANGHGYMSDPAARNVPGNGDRQSLAAGGPNTVYREGQYRHGLCGDKWNSEPQKWNVPKGIQATYTQGDSIDIEIVVTAHHGGWFDFQVCDSPDITEECFARNPLRRAVCGGNCKIWWKPLGPSEVNSWVVTHNGGYHYHVIPGGTVTFKSRFKLPGSVKCSHCVLRWHWFTTNSCPASNDNEDNSKMSEEFWNCADVRIKARHGSTPDTSPSSSLISRLKTRKGENLIPKGLNNFCPKKPHGEDSEFTNNMQCFVAGDSSSCSY